MHISTRLILGGSQENTVLSCEGQAAHGHDVTLVFGPIYGPEGSLLERVEAFRTEDNRGIETIETPDLVRELAPVKDWTCVRRLREIIRKRNPDVVHTHSSKAGILGRLAAWKERVPAVIHTIHGLPFHPYEKKWRNAVYIAAERRAAKHCHRIVCVADAMREQALAQGIGTPEQFITIYSGMETEQFLRPKWTGSDVRAELGFEEHDFVLGTVARLTELKGHDDLLDALAPVMKATSTSTSSEHGPSATLKLLWVGDGWWRDRLLARVKDLGLEGHIVTTGLVPSNRVPKYLRAMDCLAHPSYREGLPRTVPQALLSGVPVIAYDVDGTREVCIDRETGLLIPPGDPAALRRAVEWMMRHADERIAMAKRGREMCANRFAAQTMVERLDQVYESVLEESQFDRRGAGHHQRTPRA